MTTMITTKPELLLAIDKGVSSALKSMAKDAGIKNIASEAKPDQKFKGLRIDLSLEIDEMAIGHDTDKAPTVSIPWLTVTALALQKAGFQRENIMEIVGAAAREALEMGEDAHSKLYENTGVKEMEDRIKKEVVAKLPRTPVAKSVRVKGAKVSIKSAVLADSDNTQAPANV